MKVRRLHEEDHNLFSETADEEISPEIESWGMDPLDYLIALEEHRDMLRKAEDLAMKLAKHGVSK